jgi:hypothetical protein
LAHDAWGCERVGLPIKGDRSPGQWTCLRTPLMHCTLPPFEPPDGAHWCRLAPAVVGGARPRGDWRSSAIARIQGFSSCSPAAFPHQWSVWWGEASRAAASAPPSASRIFVIRAEAEERTEWGATSAWVGDPFLPPAFGGEGHPPALWRHPPAMLGKANCCSLASVQLFVLHPGGGRAACGWPLSPALEWGAIAGEDPHRSGCPHRRDRRCQLRSGPSALWL